MKTVKKISILILIAVIALSLCSCYETREPFSRYTVEVGRQVFKLDNADYEWSVSEWMTIPEGYHFVETLGGNSYICYTELSSDGENKAYGVMSMDGKLVIECKYEAVSYSGSFICGRYYDDRADVKSDVYYSDGVLLVSGDGSVSIEAIDSEYCSLYTNGASYVFDKNGVNYSGANSGLSENVCYSVCDDYLLGYDKSNGDWFIWQLYKGADNGFGFMVLDRIFEATDRVYSVAYIGANNFMVVETAENEVTYDYFETINGKNYYIKQNCYIYNADSDVEESFDSEYPIVSITNKYSPTLSITQKSAVNLNDGFSAVNAGIIKDGERVGYRYFVIDTKGRFVIRYPDGINSTAMRFIDGFGFTKGAGIGSSSGLYYMNCDVIWQRSDREYYSQSFSSGRYVLSVVQGEDIRYGVLNSEGEEVVEWNYSYISPYRNGLALFRAVDGSVGIMNADGNEVQDIEGYISTTSLTAYGLYASKARDINEIKDFNGNILISTDFDSIVYIGLEDDALYIVLQKDGAELLYKLANK